MQSKWIAKSLTIWGGLVMLLPIGSTLFGWNFTGLDLSELQSAGEKLLLAANAFVGSAMIFIGRLRANKGAQVTLLPTK